MNKIVDSENRLDNTKTSPKHIRSRILVSYLYINNNLLCLAYCVRVWPIPHSAVILAKFWICEMCIYC